MTVGDQEAGRVHADSPALAALVPATARVEKIAEGFVWSEGPVWIRNGNYLLLSDVPANRMYRWSEADGLSVFLDPSGCDGPDPSAFREPGSNGLIPGPAGTILVADHGNRAVASVDLATRQKSFLATLYEGRRFNSPNDLVLGRDGSIWFTDPPYGLQGLNASPLKEQPVNGVYRLRPGGKVELVVEDMTFPNGILLSADECTLFVANSDSERPVVLAFALDAAGQVKGREVFADFSELVSPRLPGLPDGMAIDVAGNMFITGPGGVHIFSAGGARLGRIDTGRKVANCTFGEDGRTLFIASSEMLVRVRTRTRGLGY
ncbi:MAG TPA: SMP-30/gluconolactonase/LRE family protein [Allosphingosinicella sp.]|jgi:gluconolactonase